MLAWLETIGLNWLLSKIASAFKYIYAQYKSDSEIDKKADEAIKESKDAKSQTDLDNSDRDTLG